MRARQHAQRPVAGSTVVQVQPHCHHVRQPRGGWLHKPVPFLGRPALPSGCGHLLGHGHAKVLVRGHQPVAVGGLFKIGALHGLRIGGQAGGNVGVGAQLLGQGGAPGLRQHVARAARKGVAGCMTAGCLIRQCRALRCTHHVPHQRISVCRKVLGGGKAHSAGAVLGGGACHMKRVWGRRGLSACAAPERTDRYRQLGLMHGHWARLSVRSSRRGVVGRLDSLRIWCPPRSIPA